MVQQPICPKCHSKTVVYRERDRTILCRRCGHRGPQDEFVNKLVELEMALDAELQIRAASYEERGTFLAGQIAKKELEKGR